MKYRYFDLPMDSRVQVWNNFVLAYKKAIPGGFENEIRFAVNSFLNETTWELSPKDWLEISKSAEWLTSLDTFIFL